MDRERVDKQLVAVHLLSPFPCELASQIQDLDGDSMETMWRPITYYSPGVDRRLRPLYLPRPGDSLPRTPSIY